MRIALISDMHGNLIAFEAVLQDIEHESIDRMVCLGDVAVMGSHPHETIDRLKALNCPVVMGNTDDFLLNPTPFTPRDEDSQIIYEMEVWSAEQLTDDDKAFVRTFQPTVEVIVGETTLLCFHGSPRSYDDVIRATTPDDELEQKLGGFNATLMAGGHTHTQMLRRHKNLVIINPGSIGLPYDYFLNEAYNPPYAEYAIVDIDAGKLRIDLRRVKVDSARIKDAILASGMPHGEWLIKDWH